MAICYFTYSWVEHNEKKKQMIAAILAEVKKSIEKYSDHDVSVIYDVENFNEGDDFLEREQLMKTSDTIIVFFSPDYKRKVIAGEECGVVREYKMLQECERNDEISIIPVLLYGELGDAVTEDYSSKILWDFSSLANAFNIQQGKILKNSDLGIKIKKLAQKAVCEAYATSYYKKHRYETPEEEYRILFLESSDNPLPPECLIRTSAHEQIVQ